MRNGIRGLWLCLGIFSISALAAASDPRRPNIVLLYADDMGYGDLAIQNSESRIATPNLDALAQQGMRFTDAHSSSGVCTPSRYALLTGRYHWRKFHKIVESWEGPVFSNEAITLPKMLKERGYQTACIGKWHLGWNWDAIRHPDAQPIQVGQAKTWGADAFDWQQRIPGGPLDQGFDYYFGDDVPNFPPYAWIEGDRVVEPPTVPYVPNPKPNEGSPEGRPGPMVQGWRQDEVMPSITRRAVQWIQKQNSETPFFLYFPWTSPHAPIVPATEFQGKSSTGGYGDFLMQSDWTAGEILRTLDECGFRDNTIVIFTSDNGPETYAFDRMQKSGHRSMGPLRGLKRDLWEGGHRVPCVVRWPGKVEAGRVESGLMSQIDFLSTLASIVEYPLQAGMAEDSHDQLDMWLGKGPTARTSLVHNTNPGRFAIRHQNWVLIDASSGAHSKAPNWYNEASGYVEETTPGLLFDLSNDLSQRHNLYSEDPDRVVTLKALLSTTRQRGEVR